MQNTPETPLSALPRPRVRWTLLGVMAALYIGFGLVHILRPDPFLPIMPDWVPQPRAVVILTGLCEIAGGIGLLIPRFRRLAGIMLALYAVCVFPANVKHAVENVDIPQLPHSWWYHAPRLAFQPVFVWWALFCAGVIDWPFRRRKTESAPAESFISGQQNADPKCE
jgi:uncharacterized membrane protein